MAGHLKNMLAEATVSFAAVQDRDVARRRS
jgi:hypothetical protein